MTAGCPSPPHLKEHGGFHPGLEVGCDICQLVKAALLLLLLAHAVIQRHGTLGHAACQHLHMIFLPCNNNRNRATPGFSSTHADIPEASDNNTVRSHRSALCAACAVPPDPVRWGCSGRAWRGGIWPTRPCREAPGGRGWEAAAKAAQRARIQGFRKRPLALISNQTF